MHLPKAPSACADLDLAVVERMLAKHCGDIPASARELRVSIPDLRRLTWAKPKLLEEAELERMGVIAQVWHVLITALDSDDWRRRCGPRTGSCRAGLRAIIRSLRRGGGRLLLT